MKQSTNKRTKIAKVPEELWDDRRALAKLFGCKQTTLGFAIHERLMQNKIRIKKKRSRKYNRNVWELEFEDM